MADTRILVTMLPLDIGTWEKCCWVDCTRDIHTNKHKTFPRLTKVSWLHHEDFFFPSLDFPEEIEDNQ